MTQSDTQFDLQQALEDLKAGKPLNRKDGPLSPLTKQLIQAEQAQHIASDLGNNRKNGYTSKTIKAAAGAFELDALRDRASKFEP